MGTLPVIPSITTSSLDLGIAPGPGCVSSSTTTTSKAENIMGSSPESVGTAPALKPKQSKSRNGCVTCKAKRLKCDELKPTCHQCQKRGVPCGGYKKDFKWRPFEESSLGGKAPKPQRKGNGNGVTKPRKSPPPPLVPSQAFPDQSFTSSAGLSQRSPLEPSYGTPSPSPYQIQIPQSQQFTQQPHNCFEIDSSFLSPQPSPIQIPSPPGFSLLTSRPLPGAGFRSLIPAEVIPVFVDDRSNICSELVQPPTSMHDLLGESIYLNAQNSLAIPIITNEEVDGDEIEEIIRTNLNTQEEWLAPYRSPSPSTLSTHSSSSQSSRGESFTSVHDIFRRPVFDFNSPEMLLLHFDKNTCGIMSVKDGPTENPWRTLIWPLAKQSPALYHAIASMTAFHMSRDRPFLRVEGIEHMRKSATYLAQGFSDGTIRNDAALATSLVLAFSEAFDRHISSGIEHLRGAKELVNRTLTKYQNSESSPESRQMFRFLYNVWIYLDVLARLTSEDGDGVQATVHGPLSHTSTSQVDPLLGCAATLFPLIGRVASLVQKVRKTEKNSFPIISQALDIQTKLKNWVHEDYYEKPEDPLSDVEDCIKTAEAYKYATLLYLHQAVPELQSPTAHELAEKVMTAIATIPMKSRSCIVHIYPLLAAGCEAVGKEERDWVDSRWHNMCSRMWIGNVDKAWEVVREVWHRRDQFELERQQSQALSTSGSRYGSPSIRALGLSRSVNGESPEADDFYAWGSGPVSEGSGVSPKHQTTTYLNPGRPRLRRVAMRSSITAIMGEYEEGELEYEVTVRGRLHWISVMKDRDWEVLLG